MSAQSAKDEMTVYQRPVELLQKLLRFKTVTPPGNEVECVSYIDDLLTQAGFETLTLARDPLRPNLITRLKGRGEVPPLLFHAHVDVPPVENQVWLHEPFDGKLVDGVVWGRGALDMKAGVAMMMCALMRAKAEGFQPPGDVVLLLLSDHETGAEYGAKYLVENHAALFEGIRYSIGEFGGFAAYFGGSKFYPIQVNEMQSARVKAVVKGPGKHGRAMGKLTDLLLRLSSRRLPVHITPVVHRMIEEVSSALPQPLASALRNLVDPQVTDSILDSLGVEAQEFDDVLHHRVDNIIFPRQSGITVIQHRIEVKLSFHFLPKFTVEEALAELADVVGDDVELELESFVPAAAEPDMGLFEVLRGILREADPSGTPIPFLLPGVSDGRFFSKLGVQTYGFLPMNLPEDIGFSRLIHDANERIPAESVEFGTEALYTLMHRFGNT